MRHVLQVQKRHSIRNTIPHKDRMRKSKCALAAYLHKSKILNCGVVVASAQLIAAGILQVD